MEPPGVRGAWGASFAALWANKKMKTFLIF